MGTQAALRVEAPDRTRALGAAEAAVAALEAAEARLSTWTEASELARLNAAPVGAEVELSPSLAEDLHRARLCWRATGGAFDPAVGALVEAWGLRSGGRHPSTDEIEAALAAGGLRSLALEGSRATRLHTGLLLEEGAFGKGAGLDDALTVLSAAGASRAILDLGGEVAVLGPGPFELAVSHPRRREEPVALLTIDAGAVATSGNSERGIVVEGERLGHLLDPRTGRPAPDFGSLTVWARDAMTADCLSTGLYVMGPDSALELAEATEGVEILILQPSTGGLRARASSGLAGRLTYLTDEITEHAP
jgi:thiamine biosynthesis lipoprotein